MKIKYVAHLLLLIIACNSLPIYAVANDDQSIQLKQENQEILENNTVSASAVGTYDKPNIIYIMLDDAGYDDFLTRDLIRPNIDKLKSESLLFTNFYTNPMCSPTRTSMITGRYAARYGLQWVYGGKSVRHIPEEDETIIDAMKAAGYDTSHFGKWHACSGDIEKFGDTSGIFNMGYDYVAATGAGVVENGYFGPVINYSDGTSKKYPDNEHLTDITTDEAIAYLQQNKDNGKPLFMNVWHNAPHSKLTPSPRWRDQYPPDATVESVDEKFIHVGQKNTENFLTDTNHYGNFKALFSQADENIGRLIDYVDSDPVLRENTIIMLTSDNGGTENTRPSNDTYRGAKTDIFEGGIRLPLFVRWPNKVTPRIDSSVLSINDIMPTIVSLGNGKVPATVDGINFAPIILGEKQNVARSEPIFWMHKVDGDFPSQAEFKPYNARLSWAVREGNWKLTYDPEYTDSEDAPSKMKLFDMKKDPTEMRNVASGNQDVVSSLYNKYLNWKLEVSEMVVAVAQKTGGVMESSEGAAFTFPTYVDKKAPAPRVVFEKHNFDTVSDMDITFMATINSTGRSGQVRRISYQSNSWVFQVNAQNKLELMLYDAKDGKRTTIPTTMTIEEGKTYDVAFSVTGMKKLKNYARIFVRDTASSTDGYTRVGAGIGVGSVMVSSEGISLGASPENIHMFEGTITNPKYYLSTFTAAELTNILTLNRASVLGANTSSAPLITDSSLVASVLAIAQSFIDIVQAKFSL